MSDKEGSSIAMFRMPPRVDVRPPRLKAMHGLYGRHEGEKCKTCRHLTWHEYDKRYYKCALYGRSMSASTDWRVGWEACGRWEAKEGTSSEVE